MEKNNKRIDLEQRNNCNLDTENVGWFSKIIRKFFKYNIYYNQNIQKE